MMQESAEERQARARRERHRQKEIKRRDLADKLVALSELVEKPHWNTGRPEFKSYDVLLRGKRLGEVERVSETTSRKVGRLLFGSREIRSPRWGYRTARGVGSARNTYSSRKEAHWHLIYHGIIAGEIKR